MSKSSRRFRCAAMGLCLALLVGCARSTSAFRPAPDASVDDAPAGGDDASAEADAAEASPPPWTPPAGTDPACVSGTRWTNGNVESALMNPGQACIACHRSDPGAPAYSAAGTLYYLDHEVDNCNGYSGSAPGGPSGPAVVELLDAMGQTVRVTSNPAGNFATRRPLSFPLRSARVIGPTGRVAEMGGPIPHGDCNGCHTTEGTNTGAGDPAPGRVIVPL